MEGAGLERRGAGLDRRGGRVRESEGKRCVRTPGRNDRPKTTFGFCRGLTKTLTSSAKIVIILLCIMASRRKTRWKWATSRPPEVLTVVGSPRPRSCSSNDHSGHQTTQNTNILCSASHVRSGAHACSHVKQHAETAAGPHTDTDTHTDMDTDTDTHTLKSVLF